jgi:septum formation protein
LKFILASASPRRAQLLSDAGYVFEIEPADIDEKEIPYSSPSEFAQRLAVLKAEAIAAKHPDDVVLAADTIVTLGDMVLGKPDDVAHARQMLQLLSGTTQVVITGVCVMQKSAAFQQSGRVMTAVRMDTLRPEQIDKYLASNE